MALIKRKKDVESVVESANSDETSVDLSIINRKVSLEKVVSTGSTLLDLAISGKRRTGGGLPGGIIIEIFGPPSSGKTSLLVEICGSVQSKGGQVRFCDPEARLDKEYAQIYGVSIQEHFFDYHRPDTVSEVFEDLIIPWKPDNDDVINAIANDSLAALSTKMEMEEEDKRGQRRAKEFSQGLRKTCRLIAKNNWLVPCSNQVRQGDIGEVTPGGMGIPFYASLRIRVGPAKESKIYRSVKVNIDGYTKEVKKIIGINSNCRIVKSSIDEPFREAPIAIVFGQGIDDIRANLQYVKDMTGKTKYDCITKEYVSMDNAIRHIEEHNLEQQLKDKVIEIWETVEKAFDQNRKKKER